MPIRKLGVVESGEPYSRIASIEVFIYVMPMIILSQT